MKNYFLLFVCLLILSGCDISYNLEINSDQIKEYTLINEQDIDNSSAHQLYEGYLETSIFALSKKDGLVFNPDNELDKSKYYKTKNLSVDDQVKIEFVGKFDKENPFSQSQIVNFAVKKSVVHERNNVLTIDVPGNIDIFNKHKNLDNLQINIKVDDYKVLKNNADKVSGNIYTWNLDRDNYNKKSINILLSNNMQETIDYNVNNNDKKVVLIILAFLAVFLLVVYKYVSKKMKEASKI